MPRLRKQRTGQAKSKPHMASCSAGKQGQAATPQRQHSSAPFALSRELVPDDADVLEAAVPALGIANEKIIRGMCEVTGEKDKRQATRGFECSNADVLEAAVPALSSG